MTEVSALIDDTGHSFLPGESLWWFCGGTRNLS